jgi:ubiquinone biosynthesis protein COQ4
MTKAEYSLPLDIPRALRALLALSRDPDDTQHVFTVIDSMTGSRSRYLMESFRKSELGEKLLAERRRIIPVLADRDRLRAMPKGSLAHAYLAFVESEGITADGLVEASESGRVAERTPAAEDYWYVADRMRDTHDLWHAVTGYKGDVLGEVALLGFLFAQTRNPGIGAIIFAGMTQLPKRRAVRMVLQGMRRGASAKKLFAADWEALLPRPLDEVRRMLRVDSPPDYQPIRTSMLRAEGKLREKPATQVAA